VEPRLIVLVAYPGVQSLDLCGPLDVFAGAQRLIDHTGLPDRGYRIVVAGPTMEPLRTDAGLRVTPDLALPDVPRQIHTLIVAGGATATYPRGDQALVQWLRDRAPKAERVASVCTGSFLLAQAGLLGGRRVTTHWSAARELACLYPDVEVDADPIYIQDGNVYTSAGVTSGIDLSLALVEHDLGGQAAVTIARWLVMFLRRPGNQAQFSTQLAAQSADRAPIRDLQLWLGDNLDRELTIRIMAARVRMSPRNFSRVFREQVGQTPARYLQQLRLEAAKRRLAESDLTVEKVALDCGFGSAETLRRTFIDALGVSPAEYRRRFRPRS
jgi:transcriptional regulator GlxA family with amidase domain